MSVEAIVSATLEKIKKQKNTYEMITTLEEALENPDVRCDIKQNGKQSEKLVRAYDILVRSMANELIQLSTYLASRLTELDNTAIGEKSPASHTNMSIVFDNTAHFLVDDILSAPTSAIRVRRLQRWISIFHQYCLKNDTNDYHTAAAINAGLSDAALGRLKTTFSQLSPAERKMLHELNELFLTDQGWDIMAQQLTSNKPFIPTLGGIKKTLTKSNEARKTHAMEAVHVKEELLKKQGRIASATKLQAVIPATSSTAKISIVNQLAATIHELKQDANLKCFTPLQRILTGTDDAGLNFTPQYLTFNEVKNYSTATTLECEAIKNQIINWQNELAATCSKTIAEKKLSDEKWQIYNNFLSGPYSSSTTFNQTDAYRCLKELFQIQAHSTGLNILTLSKKSSRQHAQTSLDLIAKIDESSNRLTRLTRDSSSSSSGISAFSSLSAASFNSTQGDSDPSQIDLQSEVELEVASIYEGGSQSSDLSQSAPSVKSDAPAMTPRPSVMNLFRTQSTENLINHDCPRKLTKAPHLSKASSYRLPETSSKSTGEALSPKGKPLLRRSGSASAIPSQALFFKHPANKTGKASATSLSDSVKKLTILSQ